MINRRFISRLLTILIWIVSFAGAALSVWFLVSAVSSTGRILAIAGIAFSFFLPSIQAPARSPQRSVLWRRIRTASGIIAAACLIIILFSGPNGRSEPGSGLSQHFTGEGHFSRFSITNLIPEAEQVSLGFKVMPFLDPILTREQAARVSASTLAIYGEMDQDPEFRRFGSALGGGYAELLGRTDQRGHFYLYIPENRTDGPMPVILFLHGSAGNFKAYTWIWSQLAEDLGYAVITPSFGFGNWRTSGGVESVLSALAEAGRIADLDESRVYLAGISNGGVGVSLLADEHPQLFRGLIFISPVMVPNIVASDKFQQAWSGRPVLIVTGEADERIPVGFVDQRARELAEGGVHVTYRQFPDQDHFLFFSQPSSVLDVVEAWLQENAD